jgi:hypothetical protein
MHRAPPPPPPAADCVVVKLEGGPAARVKPGQKIKLAYTLSAQSLVKHLKGDEATGLHICGAKASEAPEG